MIVWMWWGENEVQDGCQVSELVLAEWRWTSLRERALRRNRFEENELPFEQIQSEGRVEVVVASRQVEL